MYNKVDANLNFPKEEKDILDFWKENNVKKQCMSRNAGHKRFNFYEGPPTANGVPHSGHVLTRVLKDVFTRYKSMQGYFVPRKGGWDTHGLPVELSVEKELGISGKQQIEEFGVEKFIKRCKENVWKYVDIWKEFSDRVGYFVNMEDDYYVTYYDSYIESVWWALKELDKKGLLYKGYKILPSCPRCGTALSSHELAQGYEDRKDTTVVAKFRTVDDSNTYFLAWTTTPWTLPSNIALCVNADEDYVKVKANNGENYILAKALLGAHFKDGEYEIVDTFKGKTLEYKKYVPLFDFVDKKQAEKGYYVTCDSYVTLTDGTGIVHIAPAFGEDDSKVGHKYNLPFIQLVDKFGKFTAECGKYAKADVFSKNDEIVEDLRAEGKVFKSQKHVHSYPHCWRCHSPLIYFARSSWFVKTTELRQAMVKNNNTVNWLPENVKNGRMGNFLENNIDWCLSRDRYWGTPLPVWMCECGHYHVMGSKQELKDLCHVDGDIELHKPYVDALTMTCPKCGKPMHREPEVIDCWFDSGSMPFAQHHYPFENQELFKESFPAQFISEGIDQTRGWFYALQAISTALFDKSPYETCIANGMVVDDQGRKLSKSLGNYIPPMEMLSKMGADPVRWTFYTGSQPWNNLILTENTVTESQKKYFGTLWNTYAFYVLYADIDKFDPTKYSLKDCKLSVMDRWILSELNKLIEYVCSELDKFHVTESSRAMEEFVDKLSNWYIRLGRKRYWGEEFTEDKKSAYVTLYTVLSTYAKLSAPFTPFMSETIYQNIVRNFDNNQPVSVHLCDYPVVDKAMIDETLSSQMNLVREYTELGRSARNLSGIKNRQPLNELYLTDANNKTNLKDDLIQILKDELNVKDVKQHSDLSKFVNYTLKPQLKTIGPKYGKKLNAIREFLSTCDAMSVVATVEKGEVFKTMIDGDEVEFSKDDLLISVSQKEGYASATDGNIAVILDTHLTQELIEEGIYREFVSKVQNLRKSSNYVVTDRIHIEISGDKEVENIILKFANQVKQDVLALSVEVGTNGEYSEEFNLNDKMLRVSIRR